MKKINLIYAILTALLISLSSSSFAASACKGVAEKACNSKDSCSWIKAHKRKDGAKVKAYCRSKPSKKSKLSTTTSTKKSAPTQKSSTKTAVKTKTTSTKKNTTTTQK
ncbi:MAG: hypothetical protein HRU06_00875 [Oceanospirillaceae bacterium]|nr:hypothetical protein [Oceanospirillaceae bacterium]